MLRICLVGCRCSSRSSPLQTPPHFSSTVWEREFELFHCNCENFDSSHLPYQTRLFEYSLKSFHPKISLVIIWDYKWHFFLARLALERCFENSSRLLLCRSKETENREQSESFQFCNKMSNDKSTENSPKEKKSLRALGSEPCHSLKLLKML